MKCINCNAELQENEKECPYCGSKVVIDYNHCPDCGADVKDSQRYCPKCGCDLEESFNESEKTINIENPEVVEEKSDDEILAEKASVYPKKRYLVSIIAYFGIIELVSALVQVALILLYQVITKNPAAIDGKYTAEATNFINIWAQISIYAILGATAIILLWRVFKEDSKYGKRHKGRFWAMFGIGIAGIYAVSISCSIIFQLIDAYTGLGLTTSSSGNQSAINDMLSKAGALPLTLYCIVLTFVAPMVEELIFRKSLFNIFPKKSKVFKILISATVFGALHIVSSIINIIAGGGAAQVIVKDVACELIFGISYFSMGCVLGFVYEKSGENVFCSFTVHALNNFLSVVAIVGEMILKNLGYM